MEFQLTSVSRGRVRPPLTCMAPAGWAILSRKPAVFLCNLHATRSEVRETTDQDDIVYSSTQEQIQAAIICDCVCINHPFSAKVEFSAGAKVVDTLPFYTYIPKSENPNDFRVYRKSKQKTKNTNILSVHIVIIKCAIWVVYAIWSHITATGTLRYSVLGPRQKKVVEHAQLCFTSTSNLLFELLFLIINRFSPLLSQPSQLFHHPNTRFRFTQVSF